MRDYNIRDIKVCNTELQMICESRLFKLYGENIPKDVLVRFEEECKLIVKNGFSRYYLQAKQVIDELSLKQHQFFCKGMVANSFVAYLLGISSVDPISNSLCFELFSGSQGNKYPYFEFIIADMKRKQARELLNELEIDYKVIRCRRMDVLDFLERYKHYSKDIYEGQMKN